MSGFKRNPDDEMSMEDILSSIRKFVSEEDPSTIAQTSASSGQNPEEQDAHVISLDQNNIISESQPMPPSIDPYQNSRYDRRPTVIEDSAQQQPRSQSIPSSPAAAAEVDNPFNKLTEALKAYTKPKKSAAPTELSLAISVSDFMRIVVERCFDKWAKDNNLKKLIEDIVLQEIEKLKSE